MKNLLFILLAFVLAFSCSKVKEPENFVKPTDVSKQVVTTAGCSVRSGPTINAPELTQFPKDTILDVTDVFGDYVLIQTDTIKGYVWEKLLLKIGEDTIISGEGAAVNSAPNKNTTIGTLKKNTKVSILGVAVTWYQVTSKKGTKGWIYAGLVKPIK